MSDFQLKIIDDFIIQQIYIYSDATARISQTIQGNIYWRTINWIQRSHFINNNIDLWNVKRYVSSFLNLYSTAHTRLYEQMEPIIIKLTFFKVAARVYTTIGLTRDPLTDELAKHISENVMEELIAERLIKTQYQQILIKQTIDKWLNNYQLYQSFNILF